MKKRNLAVYVMISCLASGFLLSGCDGKRQIDNETVKTIKMEEEAHLQDDTTSPTCKMTIDYSYLVESAATDTVAQRINEAVQAITLGKEYASMPPAVAVDSFKNDYISNYRKLTSEFYLNDLKSGTPPSELPSWYNYEYSLTTRFSDGKEGILNVTAEFFEYTGGAHPNSWDRWLNFEKSTGKLLTLKDVFMAGAEKPISEMLMKELIADMAIRLEDEQIKTLQDLQKAGVLLSTDIYMPENFLLKKEEVSFLYNRYDIAPYSVGVIILSLPYESVEKYMLH